MCPIGQSKAAFVRFAMAPGFARSLCQEWHPSRSRNSNKFADESAVKAAALSIRGYVPPEELTLFSKAVFMLMIGMSSLEPLHTHQTLDRSKRTLIARARRCKSSRGVDDSLWPEEHVGSYIPQQPVLTKATGSSQPAGVSFQPIGKNAANPVATVIMVPWSVLVARLAGAVKIQTMANTVAARKQKHRDINYVFFSKAQSRAKATITQHFLARMRTCGIDVFKDGGTKFIRPPWSCCRWSMF